MLHAGAEKTCGSRKPQQPPRPARLLSTPARPVRCVLDLFRVQQGRLAAERIPHSSSEIRTKSCTYGDPEAGCNWINQGYNPR